MTKNTDIYLECDERDVCVGVAEEQEKGGCETRL